MQTFHLKNTTVILLCHWNTFKYLSPIHSALPEDLGNGFVSPMNTGIIKTLIHEFENASLAEQVPIVLSPGTASAAVNRSNQQRQSSLRASLSMALFLTFTRYSCPLCLVYGQGPVTNHGRLATVDSKAGRFSPQCRGAHTSRGNFSRGRQHSPPFSDDPAEMSPLSAAAVTVARLLLAAKNSLWVATRMHPFH